MRTKERLLAKEQREMTRLLRKKSKPFYPGYMLIAVAVIVLVNIVDEIATSIRSSMQSSFVTEFFITGRGLEFSDELYQEGLSTHSLISTLFMLLILLSPFYKSAADRLGRKPFFIISALGITLGLLICSVSASYLMFVVGFGILSFFVGHDMQIVYILEVAPKKSRARIYSLAKCLGILGLVLIPLLRRIFMGASDAGWRKVFLVPGLVGVIAVALVILLIKESPIFLDRRINVLSMPPEEREAAQTAGKNKNASVGKALKFIFSKKETRWLVVGLVCYYFASMAFSNYYESIMKLGGMTTEAITSALFVYPFVYCALTFISGFIGDLLGRKKVVLIFAIAALASFVLFVFGANNGWSPYPVGLLYGLYLGSYWVGGDYVQMMLSEKAPTEIRASVAGSAVFFVYGSGLVGYIITMIGMRFVPLWSICLALAVPVLTAAVVVIMLKIKDTAGADMSTAGHDAQ